MTHAFSGLRFPMDIAYGASGGPAFSTDIVTMQNGHEQRNMRWFEARARYNVAHGVKTEQQLAALIAFFRLHKGRAIAFRFQDMLDYRLEGEILGKGDGHRTEFALLKTYRYGERSETRHIHKPVESTLLVKDFTRNDYQLDENTGILRFHQAPADRKIIQVSCEFDVAVRFDVDQLHATLDDYGVYSWGEIPLVEVR